jgi:hypothetical protein
MRRNSQILKEKRMILEDEEEKSEKEENKHRHQLYEQEEVIKFSKKAKQTDIDLKTLKSFLE